MTKSLSDIQTELLGTFFEESAEGLQQLETGLLSLEDGDGSQQDVINDVFRAAHSIKGGAGSFGLSEVSSVGSRRASLWRCCWKEWTGCAAPWKLARRAERCRRASVRHSVRGWVL